MNLKAIIALAFGFVLATDGLRADSAPAGDQHVYALTSAIDDVVAAQILLKRSIDQNRSSAEVVNAANVLSDNYDRFCAHLAQFVFWKKDWESSGGPQSEFSVAAQVRLQEQANRLHLSGEVPSNFREIGDLLQKKPQYTNDPAMFTASQRLIASLNTFNALTDHANKQ